MLADRDNDLPTFRILVFLHTIIIDLVSASPIRRSYKLFPSSLNKYSVWYIAPVFKSNDTLSIESQELQRVSDYETLWCIVIIHFRHSMLGSLFLEILYISDQQHWWVSNVAPYSFTPSTSKMFSVILFILLHLKCILNPTLKCILSLRCRTWIRPKHMEIADFCTW